jgi:hypothetical protein
MCHFLSAIDAEQPIVRLLRRLAHLLRFLPVNRAALRAAMRFRCARAIRFRRRLSFGSSTGRSLACRFSQRAAPSTFSNFLSALTFSFGIDGSTGGGSFGLFTGLPRARPGRQRVTGPS